MFDRNSYKASLLLYAFFPHPNCSSVTISVTIHIGICLKQCQNRRERRLRPNQPPKRKAERPQEMTIGLKSQVRLIIDRSKELNLRYFVELEPSTSAIIDPVVAATAARILATGPCTGDYVSTFPQDLQDEVMAILRRKTLTAQPRIPAILCKQPGCSWRDGSGETAPWLNHCKKAQYVKISSFHTDLTDCIAT